MSQEIAELMPSLFWVSNVEPFSMIGIFFLHRYRKRKCKPRMGLTAQAAPSSRRNRGPLCVWLWLGEGRAVPQVLLHVFLVISEMTLAERFKILL